MAIGMQTQSIKNFILHVIPNHRSVTIDRSEGRQTLHNQLCCVANRLLCHYMPIYSPNNITFSQILIQSVDNFFIINKNDLLITYSL